MKMSLLLTKEDMAGISDRLGNYNNANAFNSTQEDELIMCKWCVTDCDNTCEFTCERSCDGSCDGSCEDATE